MWIKQLHDVGPFIVPRITYRSNIPAMRLRSRQRLRIVLAIILCLLFQQVAMAAYACTLPSMPPDPVEMADECSQMGMEVVQEAQALRAEPCSPDQGESGRAGCRESVCKDGKI